MVYESGVDDDANDLFHCNFGRALHFTIASARSACGPVFEAEDEMTKIYRVDVMSSKTELARR